MTFLRSGRSYDARAGRVPQGGDTRLPDCPVRVAYIASNPLGTDDSLVHTWRRFDVTR